jgi:Fe-S cluster assembly iron-binding protein IscA
MLTMTEAAGAHLVDLLGEAEVPEDVAIRFVVEEEELTLRLDKECPGDEALSHEGKTVLLLDEEMSPMLSGKTLDIEPSDDGPKLTLTEALPDQSEA